MKYSNYKGSCLDRASMLDLSFLVIEGRAEVD